MKHFKLVGLALLALFAFSAVATAAAQAVEAPFYSIKEGKRLGAGETKEITVKAAETFKLSATGKVITCTAVKANGGSEIIGSAKEEPGTSKEVLVFSGCTVEGNGAKCAVENGEITTNPVKNELAEVGKKSLVTFFAPETGAVFTTIKFKAESGGTCEVAETKVENQVVGRSETDKGVLIELPGPVTEEESFEIGFPTTPILEVEKIKAGVATSTEVKHLKVFGVNATLAGKALIVLANKEVWSPLP